MTATNKIEVSVIEQRKTQYAFYFRASCGKTVAMVAVESSGVRVLCENASHKTWKYGIGKLFRDAEDAIAAYKTDSMKAIIHAALAASLQD